MKITFELPHESKTFHHLKEGALFTTATGCEEGAVFMKIFLQSTVYDNKNAPAPNSVSLISGITFHFKGEAHVHEYPDAELRMGCKRK